MKKLKQLLTTVVCAFSVLFATAAEPSPGYLDLNGVDRYMKIASSSDFDIPKGGSQTVTLDVMLATNTGDLQTLIGNRFRRLQNGNNNDVS
ncbi:MAG: hypothetical protein K2I26_06180, partial [Paramuribaculum sp.]|nr:hypothetical protein [Paramuribaculum sp.]